MTGPADRNRRGDEMCVTVLNAHLTGHPETAVVVLLVLDGCHHD